MDPTITNVATWSQGDATYHAIRVDHGARVTLASGEEVPSCAEYIGCLPNAVLAALPDEAARAAALIRAAFDAMEADPALGAGTPPPAPPVQHATLEAGAEPDPAAAQERLEQLAAAQVRTELIGDPTLGAAFENAVAAELAHRETRTEDAKRAAFQAMVHAEADRRQAAGS